jgi:hypothetical protein
MQTGSSGTLIGWKSGQTTFVPLWDRMEGAWLRTLERKRERHCSTGTIFLNLNLIFLRNFRMIGILSVYFNNKLVKCSATSQLSSNKWPAWGSLRPSSFGGQNQAAWFLCSNNFPGNLATYMLTIYYLWPQVNHWYSVSYRLCNILSFLPPLPKQSPEHPPPLLKYVEALFRGTHPLINAAALNLSLS